MEKNKHMLKLYFHNSWSNYQIFICTCIYQNNTWKTFTLMPNFPVTPLRTHTLRDDVHEISSGSSVKSCCILLKVLRGTEPILDLNDHIFTGHEPKKSITWK